MKIYLNREPKTGPWGGGIKTVNKLAQSLLDHSHEVVYRLEPEIDVIVCIDPRPNAFGEWYEHFLQYKSVFGQTKILQRVGDLGTHSKPELTELVRATLQHSDFLIFPSEWAQEKIGYSGKNCQVIHNAPPEIFHKYKKNNNLSSDRIRLVTHHWSKNPKKGFHIYAQLQEYIGKSENYEFTYIGRKPDEYNFLNYFSPMPANEIAKELPKHDIYITASVEEAGANHVLEAMACGLPVIFHQDGGSIPNYCKNFGLQFSGFADMMAKIDEVAKNYQQFKNKVLEYDNDNSKVIEFYLEIIANM